MKRDTLMEPDTASRLEALLFVAQEPVAVNDLARGLETTARAVEEGLARLEARLEGGGLQLQRHGDRCQLVTRPGLAGDVERFLGLELTSRLSPAALETLALIAYNQPVTRASLELVRGVNCDGVLRSLLAKGLIEEVGRLETVGRPILYGTTFQFLQHFGLRGLEDLPPLPQAEGLAQLAGRAGDEA